MTIEEVKQFQQAISVADWKLDLRKFAELMGSDPSHLYIQQKFREVAALNKAVNKFDAETLYKILTAVA